MIVKNSDFSLIGNDNPAHAGDTIVIYATGLGQTNPALTTGLLVDPKATANTALVTATIGGQNAEVVYSIVSPGYVGLYQVAVKAPAGVTGNPALVLKQGTVSSNSVTVAVQ